MEKRRKNELRYKGLRFQNLCPLVLCFQVSYCLIKSKEERDEYNKGDKRGKNDAAIWTSFPESVPPSSASPGLISTDRKRRRERDKQNRQKSKEN